MTRRRSDAELVSYLLEYVYPDRDDPENGCRIWAGAVLPNEYPKFMRDKKHFLARRELLRLTRRGFLPSHVVWDTCGERKCMNPKHLRFGTRGEMYAMHQARGTYKQHNHALLAIFGKVGVAKLNVTEYPTVRRLVAEGKTYREIGARYGVTKTTVGHSLRSWRRALGDTWLPPITTNEINELEK